MRNGYIRIEIKGKMAICHLFPPEEGGNAINFMEMDAYLKKHGFINYDRNAFREKMATNQHETMSLGLCDGLEFSEAFSGAF